MAPKLPSQLAPHNIGKRQPGFVSATIWDNQLKLSKYFILENPCVTNPCPVGAAHCLVGNDDKYGRYCYTATWAQMFDRGDDA